MSKNKNQDTEKSQNLMLKTIHTIKKQDMALLL